MPCYVWFRDTSRSLTVEVYPRSVLGLHTKIQADLLMNGAIGSGIDTATRRVVGGRGSPNLRGHCVNSHGLLLNFAKSVWSAYME